MRIARVTRWLAFGVLALSVLFLFISVWLLRSGSGRDFALARVLAALPADSLSWRSAEGTISGPLVLHGVRYTHEGLLIEVERAELDLAPMALIGRTLQIESLTLERGRVVLPPGDDTPEPWPRRIELPSALPEVQLPFAVSLDAMSLRAIRIEQGELALLDVKRLEAAGRFERGRLALQKLEIDSDRATLRARGVLDTAQHWDTGLQARLDLIGVAAEPLPLDIDARGDWNDMTLTARANLPAAATMSLRVVGGLPDPQWQLTVDAPQLDPRRFGVEGEVLALNLSGEGDLGRVTLQGHVVQGERRLRLESSTLRLDDGLVHVEPVILALEPGRIEARGTVDLREDAPRLALDLVARELELPAEDGAAVVRIAGKARIEGPLADYVATLDATLARSERRAEVTLRGKGDEHGLDLAEASLVSARGRLDATGRVDWSPQPRWNLDATLRGFDPSWLVPDFPGAVDARVSSEGVVGDSGVEAKFRADPLGGTLRGRALAGRIEATLQAGGEGHGAGELRLGESRVDAEARWGDSLEAQIALQPLLLNDLWPEARGRLQGRVTISGTRDAPTLAADLDGSDLAFGANTIAQLRLSAQVEQGERGRVMLDARGLELGGQPFETANLHAEGLRGEHRVTLALRGGPAELDLALAGGEREGRWRGRLQQLRVVPRDQKPWELRAPADLAIDRADGVLRLSETCLAAATASLCAQVDWSAGGGEATVTLDALPLATFDPFLANALDAPASAYGTLSGQASMTRDAKGLLRGETHLTSREGGLRLDPEAPRDWLVFRDLDLRGQLDPAKAMVLAKAGLGADGEFDLAIDTAEPMEPDGALRGRVSARLRDLTFLELFGDALVSPRGALDAELTLAGTRTQPQLVGMAELREFASEVPALGLKLSGGRVALRSNGSSAADIEGVVRSGEGELRVDGRFDPTATERLTLNLRGENFTAVAIPEASATVSPELNLRWQAERLLLRGKVTVPRARIELERLQSATAPSPDAVIIDAGGEAKGEALKLDSDIEVVLGDDVRLTGFGLKGKLDGKLGLRDRPGRASVARGGLQVGGEYKAYGQDLKITRGRLSYASTPLDNPALDIRAEREIDKVTVGVQVRGTALAPELTLWSQPALDQAEQLSYLVLGRPLRSASQADGAQLSQAAAAFGGNLLAQKLGARMGLDEVGVADNRALGGAALTVGKYLSPKLYVSYGVALFGSGQVVTFKYLLSRVWSVQIDSGSENRAALNYRLER